MNQNCHKPTLLQTKTLILLLIKSKVIFNKVYKLTLL